MVPSSFVLTVPACRSVERWHDMQTRERDLFPSTHDSAGPFKRMNDIRMEIMKPMSIEGVLLSKQNKGSTWMFYFGGPPTQIKIPNGQDDTRLDSIRTGTRLVISRGWKYLRMGRAPVYDTYIR